MKVRASLATRRRREGPRYHECRKGHANLDCKKYLSVKGRSEYKAWNKKVKELRDESKMRVGEKFDRKLSENL